MEMHTSVQMHKHWF